MDEAQKFQAVDQNSYLPSYHLM